MLVLSADFGTTWNRRKKCATMKREILSNVRNFDLVQNITHLLFSWVFAVFCVIVIFRLAILYALHLFWYLVTFAFPLLSLHRKFSSSLASELHTSQWNCNIFLPFIANAVRFYLKWPLKHAKRISNYTLKWIQFVDWFDCVTINMMMMLLSSTSMSAFSLLHQALCYECRHSTQSTTNYVIQVNYNVILN